MTQKFSADIASQLLSSALSLGATAADAILVTSSDLSCSIRKGKQEGLERAESAALGLRVLAGKKQAIVSTTDFNEATLHELAARAIAMAKAAPDDPFSGLAEPAEQAVHFPELDLHDGEEPSPEWMMEQCRIAEDAALSAPGITNSEGAEASYGASRVTLATSSGFSGSYRTSYHSLSVSVLAGEGTGMERDYDYTTARFRGDLASAEIIGKSAASLTLRRLNPRKVKTCEVPVLFDPRVGRSLLLAFAGAINGASVARGTSFLKGCMGEAVFGEGVTIMDDPHILRGLGSKPFDGEGVANAKRALVERGVLQSWLLDCRSARQLGLKTTGHAARGVSSPPSPSSTNLYVQPGALTPAAMIAEVKNGLYVTDLFGMGVNLVTGDYSQGAAGIWIENGALAYPVSEITIAGHLGAMFRQLTPASDLTFKYAANTPTLRVERMTVAGS